MRNHGTLIGKSMNIIYIAKPQMKCWTTKGYSKDCPKNWALRINPKKTHVPLAGIEMTSFFLWQKIIPDGPKHQDLPYPIISCFKVGEQTPTLINVGQALRVNFPCLANPLVVRSEGGSSCFQKSSPVHRPVFFHVELPMILRSQLYQLIY